MTEIEIIIDDFFVNYVPLFERRGKHRSFATVPINKELFEEFNKKHNSFFKTMSEICYILDKLTKEDLIKEKTCYCGKIKKFKEYTTGYAPYCSMKCQANSPLVIERRNNSKLEKYGDINYNNRSKAKSTCLEKYGVDVPAKSDIVKNKQEQTNNDKYGCKSVLQLLDIRERGRITRKEKYGDENYNNRSKAKSTCLEKYGVASPLLVEEFENKRKQTSLERYGVEHHLQSDVIIEKRKNTFEQRYNRPCHSYNHFTNFENFTIEFVLSNFVNDHTLNVDKFCEYFSCGWQSFNNFRKRHKKQFRGIITISDGLKAQKEIYKFIADKCCSDDILFNDRNIISPFELDIALLDKKIAIEYDGIMYHSFGHSTFDKFDNWREESRKKYCHKNKTELCLKNGFELLHIFENEWLDDIKKEIWKSMMGSKLGLHERKYARDCVVCEIDSKIKDEFLFDNHLQGIDKSTIKLGLFYQNELVSVMTFGKPRYNKKYQYELIRFCSRQGITVVGGASKLFKYFVRNYNPDSVISYANRRWSNGNLYRKIGFTEIGVTEPNYFYFESREMKMYSRNKFQKHKIKNMNLCYDDSMTETENMYNNGYRKIYDCGNLIFEWRKD